MYRRQTIESIVVILFLVLTTKIEIPYLVTGSFSMSLSVNKTLPSRISSINLEDGTSFIFQQIHLKVYILNCTYSCILNYLLINESDHLILGQLRNQRSALTNNITLGLRTTNQGIHLNFSLGIWIY